MNPPNYPNWLLLGNGDEAGLMSVTGVTSSVESRRHILKFSNLLYVITTTIALLPFSLYLVM